MIARVPATSANIGPGFDSLGVALTMWAEVGLLDGDDVVPVRAHRADRHHLATVAFRSFGGDGELWVRSPIPMGRGLGYSAAVRVGGLLLAARQQGSSVEHRRDEILTMAATLEGHADNAAPALLGGVVATTGERSLRVPLHLDPTIVVWVPTFSTRTDQSRAKLSATISLADAVFNIGRTALLVAALAAGDVDSLRHAVDDRLHQAQRFQSSPASRAAYGAALEAGAWCAWLSGSGPTIAAMCATERADAIAAALPSDGHTKILRIDHGGATVD